MRSSLTGEVMASLSVIIVNWNTRELLAQCLRSVDGSVDTLGRSNVQTLVVDNASTDGSAPMVQERFPWVEVIANAENVGFARANNQGIQSSSGRYVVLLNSDTEVHPGALEALVRFMEATPGAGVCGPKLVNADGSLQASCHPTLTPGREFWRLIFLDRIWQRATYDQSRWRSETAHQVEVIKGACLCLRRAALDQVGLLDEQYFMYTEEMDLCYRLAQAGWEPWWVPSAVVTHHGEASSRQVAEEMYIQLYRSKVQFHRKFGGARQADRFKRLVWLAYVPRLAIAAAGAPFSGSLARQAGTFRRLLAELPGM
jgi:N-acetylglucosaminyl-diphospho-decaprenol L-rhamnosyltransferase